MARTLANLLSSLYPIRVRRKHARVSGGYRWWLFDTYGHVVASGLVLRFADVRPAQDEFKRSYVRRQMHGRARYRKTHA